MILIAVVQPCKLFALYLPSESLFDLLTFRSLSDFLVACVVVFFFLYKAAVFYRSSAREMKRIDSILRSSICEFDPSRLPFSFVISTHPISFFTHCRRSLWRVADRSQYHSSVRRSPSFPRGQHSDDRSREPSLLPHSLESTVAWSSS